MGQKDENFLINTYENCIFINKCCRIICWIFWPNKIKTVTYGHLQKKKKIEITIRKRKWKWISHVLRKPHGNITKQAFDCNNICIEKSYTKRTETVWYVKTRGKKPSKRKEEVEGFCTPNFKHSGKCIGVADLSPLNRQCPLHHGCYRMKKKTWCREGSSRKTS